MSILSIIIVLIVVGLLFYVVEQLLPISPTIKVVIRILLIVFLCLWLLSIAGIVGVPRFN